MNEMRARAQFVTDQTNARLSDALDALFAAIRGNDLAVIDAVVSEFGRASWDAGWDQAHAHIRAIVLDEFDIDIGGGSL